MFSSPKLKKYIHTRTRTQKYTFKSTSKVKTTRLSKHHKQPRQSHAHTAQRASLADTKCTNYLLTLLIKVAPRLGNMHQITSSQSSAHRNTIQIQPKKHTHRHIRHVQSVAYSKTLRTSSQWHAHRHITHVQLKARTHRHITYF